MIDKLEKILERYEELSKLLSHTSVISNQDLFKNTQLV